MAVVQTKTEVTKSRPMPSEVDEDTDFTGYTVNHGNPVGADGSVHNGATEVHTQYDVWLVGDDGIITGKKGKASK